MKQRNKQANTTQTNGHPKRPVSNRASIIEEKVMKRVRRIHLLRRFINRKALKMYGVATLSLALFSMVSFTNVYANMPSLLQPTSLFHFLLQAVKHTEALVQITLFLLIVVVALFIRDMYENTQKDRVANALAQG